jgi:hypothetical protein
MVATVSARLQGACRQIYGGHPTVRRRRTDLLKHAACALQRAGYVGS